MGEIAVRRGLLPEHIEPLLKWANSGGPDFLRQFAGPRWRYPLTGEQVAAEAGDIWEILDGGAFAGIIQRIFVRDRVAHIGRFLLDPERAGRGIGTAALRRFCEALFEGGEADAVSLNVYLFNARARRCYEKCGFRVTSVNADAKPWPNCRMELWNGPHRKGPAKRAEGLMNITTRQFQPLTDVQRVWDFMVEVYEPDLSNGVPAPFFEYALASSWLDKNYLFMDRLWLDGERIVAFAFYEQPCTDVFVNLRPGYEGLADEIVEYGEACMPHFDGEKAFVLFPGQKALIEAVQARGYAIGHEETDYYFDFAAGKLDRPLPEGFRFIDPPSCDPEKLARCFWKGFGHAERAPFENWTDRVRGEEWGVQRSYYGVLGESVAPPPHSTYDYNVIIADAAGEYACFSGMWWVPENRLAYMEPLCTIPEYRRMGLAEAALSAHVRRLRPLGARLMTGGGSPFYRKIGFEVEQRWLHWEKTGNRKQG